MSNIYIEIFGQSLFILSVISMIFGVVMLIKPDVIMHLSNRMNTWIETGSYIDKVNRQQNTDHLFYRYHKLIGALIVIGALYTLYNLVIRTEGQSFVTMLPASWHIDAREWISDAIVYFIDVINILAIFFGIIIFTRPSALKDIEELANRWLTSESRLAVLDKQISTDDKESENTLRIIGLLVILGSFYILVVTLQFFN